MARSSFPLRLTHVLPGIAILLGGGILVLWPLLREIRILEQRVANHGDPVTQSSQLAHAHAEAASADAEAKEMDARLDRSPSFDSRSAMDRISRLCLKHQLTLAAAIPEPSSEKLPAHFKTWLAQSSLAGQPRVWKIELAGAYGSVASLVGEIGTGAPIVLPLSLAMRPAAEPGDPKAWTLYLWL